MTNKEFLKFINDSPHVLKPDDIMRCLKGADAIWLYEGEPKADKPHARLTSGKHSDGYVNVGAVLKKYSGFRKAVALTLVSVLAKKWDGRITQVVGADTSSTDLAAEVAGILNAKHVRMEKVQDRKKKRQLWNENNKLLERGDIVLHIEELLTTSFSALEVRKGIRQRHPGCMIGFVPFLPVVVERSDPKNRVTELENSKVLPLLRLEISNYDEDSCAYCAVGSEAIKPKEGNNWSRLTGK